MSFACVSNTQRHNHTNKLTSSSTYPLTNVPTHKLKKLKNSPIDKLTNSQPHKLASKQRVSQRKPETNNYGSKEITKQDCRKQDDTLLHGRVRRVGVLGKRTGGRKPLVRVRVPSRFNLPDGGV